MNIEVPDGFEILFKLPAFLRKDVDDKRIFQRGSLIFFEGKIKLDIAVHNVGGTFKIGKILQKMQNPVAEQLTLTPCIAVGDFSCAVKGNPGQHVYAFGKTVGNGFGIMGVLSQTF